MPSNTHPLSQSQAYQNLSSDPMHPTTTHVSETTDSQNALGRIKHSSDSEGSHKITRGRAARKRISEGDSSKSQNEMLSSPAALLISPPMSNRKQTASLIRNIKAEDLDSSLLLQNARQEDENVARTNLLSTREGNQSGRTQSKTNGKVSTSPYHDALAGEESIRLAIDQRQARSQTRKKTSVDITRSSNEEQELSLQTPLSNTKGKSVPCKTAIKLEKDYMISDAGDAFPTNRQNEHGTQAVVDVDQSPEPPEKLVAIQHGGSNTQSSKTESDESQPLFHAKSGPPLAHNPQEAADLYLDSLDKDDARIEQMLRSGLSKKTTDEELPEAGPSNSRSLSHVHESGRPQLENQKRRRQSDIEEITAIERTVHDSEAWKLPSFERKRRKLGIESLPVQQERAFSTPSTSASSGMRSSEARLLHQMNSSVSQADFSFPS